MVSARKSSPLERAQQLALLVRRYEVRDVGKALGQLAGSRVHRYPGIGISTRYTRRGDDMATATSERVPVPRDREDDYTREAAARRREFAEERTGASLEHVSSYSFDPSVLTGNVEQFLGAAQVPIGLAGPLLVNGEDAQGEFYVPLATAEGTLVASYNRGMRLLHEAGGVTTTIMDDRMQRAPAFLFESARQAREFSQWLGDHFDEIKAAAEATTRSGKLQDIERYSASRILYTRFNYTTGDAAGQNLTGKATAAACKWIVEHHPDIQHFFLESNFATDKKSSQVNMLNTRGKRVVAEAVIPDALIQRVMRSSTDLMFRARQVSNLGGFMSGVNNNGAHSANGITAMFIATGQDAANVAESSAAFVHAELRENGDYYYSVTIPSLIVATYGGGTGLATQRECLELLGCYGKGKVRKFAEIVAATVLCGELSLGSAIVAEEWVDAHDLYGRNRP
jgi:hydroxymethylglutaryl-CoA reductase (NADPH)